MLEVMDAIEACSSGIGEHRLLSSFHRCSTRRKRGKSLGGTRASLNREIEHDGLGECQGAKTIYADLRRGGNAKKAARGICEAASSYQNRTAAAASSGELLLVSRTKGFEGSGVRVRG